MNILKVMQSHALPPIVSDARITRTMISNEANGQNWQGAFQSGSVNWVELPGSHWLPGNRPGLQDYWAATA